MSIHLLLLLAILAMLVVGFVLAPIFWPTLTSDQWVIRSVSEEFRIPFISIPSVPFTQSNMGMSAEFEAICDTEVQSLLQKKAIEIVPETELCFVSGLFVIPKRTGGYRPIVNLKGLNRYIEYHHFKMEGVQILKDAHLIFSPR
jgi:hypothetical protein